MPPRRQQPWPTSEPSAQLTAISSTRRQSPGATSSDPAGLPPRGNGVRRDRPRVSSVIRMDSCSCPAVPTSSSPPVKTRGFNCSTELASSSGSGPVSGLSNRTPYTFTVIATNSVGTGAGRCPRLGLAETPTVERIRRGLGPAPVAINVPRALCPMPCA
jgi:hypothetical protein